MNVNGPASFSDSSKDVAMATDFMAIFGYMRLFGKVVLKTVCNIATPIQKYSVAICWLHSVILCKYDENRSSNPRDYEGNNCTF